MSKPEPVWVRIPPTDDLRGHDAKKVDGVEINVFTSPYNVPEAVRGRFDTTIRKFVIEFKYLDEAERYVEEQHGEHVTLRIGKNSRRLMGIQLDVEGLQVQQVALRVLKPKLVDKVKKAIGELSQKTVAAASRDNYDAARKVISDRGEELFEELVGA